MTLQVQNGKATFEGEPGQIITPGPWAIALHNKGGAGAVSKVTATFTPAL